MAERHVSLDLAKQLHLLAIQIEAAVRDELHAASMPGRTVEASVSGGSRSDPSGSRALSGAASADPDADGNVSPDPKQFGSVSGNRTLSFAAPKLRKAVEDATRALDVLHPRPGRDREGGETDRKSCRVCGCCRAVHPKGRDRQATRCDGCYQFRRRWGRDRNSEEVGEHQERMWAEEQDRRTRGTG